MLAAAGSGKKGGVGMKWQGAVFDLDGTLLDSMHIWSTFASDYLRSKGIEPKEDVDAKLAAASMQQAAGYFREEYGFVQTEKAIIDDIDMRIRHFYQNDVGPKEGAAAFLQALKEKNIRMCVATATDRPLAEAALIRCRLRPYFKGILTLAELESSKERPDIYLEAMRLLGTSMEETIIFEDAVHAVKTAHDAGFTVCGVYDPSEKRQEEIRKYSDYYLRNYFETEMILR
jgi:HAD superfamily hydrolase (TIGR01509 family)